MSSRNEERLDFGSVSRRSALKWAGAGLGSLALGGVARAVLPGKFDVHIRLYADAATAQILPGAATNVYQYTAKLIYGPRDTIQRIPGSHIGPTLHFLTGQRVRIEFVNRLAEETVVHLHGLHVPMSADGHPLNTVPPGGVWNHEFTVLNQAGTYWYHAHTDMRTGFQVNRGLAGMILVHDKADDLAPVPKRPYDLALAIQDRRFNSGNQLVHSTGSQTGFLGDKILVNGIYAQPIAVSERCYRLRILNGCNSRIFKLGWSDGSPVCVLGTTGGLLPAPEERPYVMLSPGDRVELWADFYDRPVGSEVSLMTLPFENGGPGSGYPPQGTQMELQRFVVQAGSMEYLPLPSELRPFPQWDRSQAVNAENSRVFALEYMGMWTINGNTFELSNYTNDEEVRLNQLELWEIRNDLPNAVTQAHPMHFHGPQFQIVRRWMEDDLYWYDSVREGFVDGGWHDTILAFPGERVEFLTRWTDYTGLFLYHCHNLEHEDMGMMRNLYVHT